jgi:hypothetical protein
VNFDEIILFKNFSKRQYIQIPHAEGHGGGDDLMRDQIFLPNIPDPMQQCAGTRDGALACLVGIAARNSIASKQPVKIADLTSIKPQEKKEYQRERKHIIPRTCTGVFSILKIYFLVHLPLPSALTKNDFCHLAYLCVSCEKAILTPLPQETQLTDCTGVCLCAARTESLNTICFNFAVDYFY